MSRKLAAALTLLIVGSAALPGCVRTVPISPPSGGLDIVHVAPPMGERDDDRASILAALEQVQPGGTVQFAPGTYLVGPMIRIPTTGITLLGHPDDTVLRGCDPDEYEEMEWAVEPAFESDPASVAAAVARCGMFELTGGQVTVRHITFEYSRLGLVLGCCHGERPPRLTDGGYLIAGNTFRNSGNGIRPGMLSADPTVIRGNTFINTFHAVSAYGGHLHVLENDISVPEPHRVPGVGHPSFAIALCGEHNLIAGNRIEGHPDGILLIADPGAACRENVIRDNTIAVRRVPFPARRPYPDMPRITDQADSTIVGVPLLLYAFAGEEEKGIVEENLIEGNRLLGSDGIAVEAVRASRNRFVGNTVSGVVARTPFPGNTLGSNTGWSAANGAGIWLSPGSYENEVVANTLEDIVGHAIVIEGDRNWVETRSMSDSVRDLGSANRVISRALPPPATDTLETGRLIFHQLLHPVGEEIYAITREGETRVLRARFTHNDRGRVTERSAELRFRAGPEPVVFRLRETTVMDTTDVAVEVNRGQATVTDATGSRQVPAPDRYFTTSGFAPHTVQAMLVRYRLENEQPDSIPVLPRGNATVHHVGEDTLLVDGKETVLDRYHVDGHWWGGQTLWLDGADRLVAAVTFDFNYQAVREGYEDAVAFFSGRGRRDALARAEAANGLRQPLRVGPFALVGGVLIDGTGAPPLPDATVVVRDGRIAAVGPRAEVAIPDDAAVVDVSGRTVLPGFWDMHAHVAGIVDFGPIYLAAGVTTVRDLGNEPDWLLALRDAFATGRIAGPRLLMAAEIDGRVPEAVGAIQADTPEEARALVRHFHELGFEQIKIYSRLRPELVPVIAEEAHALGMTVTGHVPRGMNTIEAVQAGMDQINHILSLTPILPDSILDSGDQARIRAATINLDTGSAEVQRLIETLVEHGTVVDPTLALFGIVWRPASMPMHEIEPGAARMPPDMAATIEAWFRGVPDEQADEAQGFYRTAVAFVGALHRAGVPIVAGTDVLVPGHGLHRELEVYVEAGMTPMEAIRSATAVPARAMGLEHEAGTLEAGKRADLIVVDGDPLGDIREIRNVTAVVANGRMFDTAALWRSAGFADDAAAVRDTVRYSVIIEGQPWAERRMWQEAPDTWWYEYEGPGFYGHLAPGVEQLTLDTAGIPVGMMVSLPGPSVRERFERDDRRARWSVSRNDDPGSMSSRTVEQDEVESPGPAYYSPVHRIHDVGVVARALLRQPNGVLPLLPEGEARLEPLGTRTVEADGRIRTVLHYAVHGGDLKPAYVWLDADGATFADEWSILAGWEPVFSELRAETAAALAEHHRHLAAGLVPPARERPLVIRGASLFDPHTGAVRPGTTIVVEGNRIAVVGADASVETPAGAEVIEAAGRMVLPGLWDMHAYHGISQDYLELEAPLRLAAGVTTARDMGSPAEAMRSLRQRIEAGDALGPRLLLGGLIEGTGGSPLGLLAGDADEARAAVDRYAEMGYVQIKTYNRLPADVIRAVTERARHHGLRMSGHVPPGMTLGETVESGFDEAQHINQIFRHLALPETGVEAEAALGPDSEAGRRFIALLVARGAAIDPNLGDAYLGRCEQRAWVEEVASRLPALAARRFGAGIALWACPHPRMDEALANMSRLVRAAHEAGVPVLPGAIMSPGFGLHTELVEYAAAGIPAPDVLHLATLGAARVMGMEDELGSIEPGKLADLILVDGDPAADIRDIRRVMTVVKDGRVYDTAALYRALGIKPCCEE